MKKNVLRKDFFMEIRKSIGRFLSVFLIVALGTSLFAGIRSAEPDMILSGDAYADENQIMDIKIVSTLGLTDDDVDVIERLPDIETAEGSYSMDVLCDAGENKAVLHVMSLTENMNRVHVVEGRLPETSGECLMDRDFMAKSGYQLGDTITLESGTDAELTESLKQEEFKIVGSGDSPLYFSFSRGSSNIGNGSVKGFLIVSPDSFDMQVYTEVYALVDGAMDAMSFTEEYGQIVDEAIEQIELIQNVRCEVRRNNLAEEAQLQIDDARNELYEKQKEAEDEISKNEDQLKDAELELKLGKLQVESGKAQIESAKAELASKKQEYQTLKELYDQALSRLHTERDELNQQIADAEQRASELEDTEKEIALAAIEPLKEALSNLETKMTELEQEASSKFADSEKQIADAEALLSKKERELSKAQKELNIGEQKVEIGKNEIANAKEEMEEGIAEGEKEIDEAEEEISKIELPTWYVFDRSSISEYSGYGDNATRIGSLAIVFPSIFFLVAALISLTTMTRMVEEQRVQIGTLKALGYHKFSIMNKFVSYALAATLGGSILGVLVGGKLFPYIIITAYGIMYTHIPHCIMPYQWDVSIVATLIAVFCTGVATISACYKELMAQPAILMRPEAPKIGKRTLIERIPFLWKHLNFSWKSSLRNLFRYKKRFFMTLFGIGGCMGLLMVGFGLRDSITSIADHQYGELQLYDNSVFLSEDFAEEERGELESYLERNINVTAFMNTHMSSITAKNDKEQVDVYLTVISDMGKLDEFFVYRNRVTKKPYTLSDEGVILTEKASKLLGVKAGDTLLLTGDGKNEKKVKITAVCENYTGHYVYLTESLYQELYGDEIFYNTVLIKTDDGFAQKDLEKIGEKILGFDHVLNVQYTKNLKGSLTDMLGALDQVMIVLIFVAGMLSFVVLYNLNNINITERRRELATLKVLGFFDLEVAEYVYRENIMLTLLGTIVGCGIGKFLHLFTITTVEVDLAMFGRQIRGQSYLICALFTIGFSAIVNIIMYFKLKKIDMVESLKSVE